MWLTSTWFGHFAFTITKFVGGKSGAFFVKQQNSIGAVNGYIEEMIHGQKVIKVFCHEEQTKADFDKHNNELFQNAARNHIPAKSSEAPLALSLEIAPAFPQ